MLLTAAFTKLIKLAANLFNGSMEVSPSELINTLDDENFELALQAIFSDVPAAMSGICFLRWRRFLNWNRKTKTKKKCRCSKALMSKLPIEKTNDFLR